MLLSTTWHSPSAPLAQNQNPLPPACAHPGAQAFFGLLPGNQSPMCSLIALIPQDTAGSVKFPNIYNRLKPGFRL